MVSNSQTPPLPADQPRLRVSCFLSVLRARGGNLRLRLTCLLSRSEQDVLDRPLCLRLFLFLLLEERLVFLVDVVLILVVDVDKGALDVSES
jgi:hypothetical protein